MLRLRGPCPGANVARRTGVFAPPGTSGRREIGLKTEEDHPVPRDSSYKSEMLPLRERKAALDKAVSTLNEEGQHRQKAEALRSAVGEIVCHFQDQGKRRKLVSIEVVAVEGGAAQPVTFPGVTLQSDTRLCDFAWNTGDQPILVLQCRLTEF